MTRDHAARAALLACFLSVACVDTSNPAATGYSYVSSESNDLQPGAARNGAAPPGVVSPPSPGPSPTPTPPVFVLAPVTTRQNPAAAAPLNFISAQQPNTCLDIPNAAPAANLKLGYWYCNGVTAAQAWLWGSGVLQSSGPYCLGLADGETLMPGAHPTLQACAADGSGTGIFWEYNNGRLVVSNSNLCISRAGQPGTGVELRVCDAADAAQAWALGANDGNAVSAMRIRHQVGGVCLDGLSPQALRVTACDGTVAQQWLWEGGALRTGGKCLSLAAADPNTVQVTTCTGETSQSWLLRGNSIVNERTGACLTPSDTPSADATTPVLMRPCAPNGVQTWVLGGT